MLNKIVLIALRQPYTFVVMSILIVLFAGRTIMHMPSDVFPNVTVPVTSVVWLYVGMLPQKIEGRITYLFERSLTSTVEGIKYIHSDSYYGISITNIYLQDGIDVGRAEADIVGIAQNVVRALPPDISPPMVMRLAPAGYSSLRMDLVLLHFLLSVFMVEWAIVLAFLLRSLRLSWRSHVAAISFGFGVYSAALLAGGGYFTIGREMSDYVFFSFFRISVYLLILLWWAVTLWLPEPKSDVA